MTTLHILSLCKIIYTICDQFDLYKTYSNGLYIQSILAYLCPISWARIYTDVNPADGYGLPNVLVVPNSAITHAYRSRQTPATVAKPMVAPFQRPFSHAWKSKLHQYMCY